MSTAPTHASVAGRTYLALRKLAREEGRATEEYLRLAALEAFVDRLASSSRAQDLVLKGGVLLAAYNARRPTRDVDLAAVRVANEPAAISAVVDEILAVAREDGWTDGPTSARPIREEDVYGGVRVTVPCALASAKLAFNVDVNVGDVVSPPPVEVSLPRLLGGEIRARGYPLTMVLAEKIVTAVQRTTINTRWRDFADVALLSRQHGFVGAELERSIRAVAAQRAVALAPLAVVLEGYATSARNRWVAWVRKQQLIERLPLDFAAVLEEVQGFVDPVLTGGVRQQEWDFRGRRWVRSNLR